jgi:hypothetical protein
MADRTRQTAVFGGAVSILLNLYSGWNSPQFVLRVLFLFWVAGPFMALVIGNRRALKWDARSRGILVVVTWLVVIVSLAVYVHATVAPGAWNPVAFPWTATPGLSWGLIAVGALIAKLVRPRAKSGADPAS